MRPPYAKLFAPWENEGMAEGGSLDFEAIRDAIRDLMEAKGLKPTTLSLRVGKSRTLVSEVLGGNGDVKLSTLQRLAGALDVDIDVLLRRPRVPIAGYIGAGGHVIFEEYGETLEPDRTVLRPPGVSGKLVALLVRGESMLPKYRDGDIIYIQRDHEGLLAEYIGEDCAVRLVSGETYIKQLAFGSAEGLYTLRSLNAADMIDVQVEWATPVLFIMPARARLMTA